MQADESGLAVRHQLSQEAVGASLHCVRPLEIHLQVHVRLGHGKGARRTSEGQYGKAIGRILVAPLEHVVTERRLVAERAEEFVLVEVDAKSIPERSERIAIFGVAAVLARAGDGRTCRIAEHGALALGPNDRGHLAHKLVHQDDARVLTQRLYFEVSLKWCLILCNIEAKNRLEKI